LKLWRRAELNAATVVGAHLAVLAVWQAACMTLNIPRFILPQPPDVVVTLSQAKHDFLNNTIVTAIQIFGGYLLGIAVGGVLALEHRTTM
jgi:NitT/TauT family transport system permease protein